MEIYVAGFNSHSQLSTRSTKETLHTFEREWNRHTFQFACSLWSVSVLSKDDSFYSFGYISGEKKSMPICGLPASRAKQLFGDTSGVRGVVGHNGSLYELKDNIHLGKDGLHLIEQQTPFNVLGT